MGSPNNGLRDLRRSQGIRRKVENNRTKKLELSFNKKNLLEEETLTSLDSTCLRKSGAVGVDLHSSGLFLYMALEEGNAPFVDEETEAEIIP